MDPAEFRRRNMVPKAKFPYKIVAGFEYDCGDFEGVLDEGADAKPTGTDLPRGERSPRKRGKLRGRGIATYIEATAPGGFAPYDQAHITWEKDGSVTLRTASHNHGQGHETTFAQIVVGRARHPDGARSACAPSEPEFNLVANPTGGSRTLHGLGSAMLLAAQRDREERPGPRRRGAGERAQADIEFAAGDLPHQGHRPQDRHHGAGAEVPGQARPRLQGAAQGAGSPSRTAATSPKWRSSPRRARPRSCPTSPATTPATSSTTRSSKGRCRAASRRARGTSSASRRSTTRSGQLLTGSFMDYAMPRAGPGRRPAGHRAPGADRDQSARRQGRGRGGRDRLDALPDERGDGCAAPGGRQALRHAGEPQRVWQAIREAKAGRPEALAIAPL